MGKGMLPAGSICPRVRHQTFTSTHQLFSALRCRSVSMPQWQTTKTRARRETGIGGHRGGGRERRGDGWRKKVMIWGMEGETEKQRHKGGWRMKKDIWGLEEKLEKWKKVAGVAFERTVFIKSDDITAVTLSGHYFWNETYLYYLTDSSMIHASPFSLCMSLAWLFFNYSILFIQMCAHVMIVPGRSKSVTGDKPLTQHIRDPGSNTQELRTFQVFAVENARKKNGGNPSGGTVWTCVHVTPKLLYPTGEERGFLWQIHV